MNILRWGIVGCGKIAHRWMNGAMQVENMEVSAVMGRNRENVDRFCGQYDIKKRYYSYEDLIKDGEIDCIYVATPHVSHKSLSIEAMKYGKHILVEKPIAVSEKDALEMIECAKEHGVLIMEAVWTRFFPIMQILKDFISSGKLGEVRSVHASFSFSAPVDKSSRLFDPMQAGGGLLDVGVYPLHFADFVYGIEPLDIFGYAAISTDEHCIEVDEQASFISKYEDGAMAVMSSGIRTQMPDTAVIYATEAMITVPRFWSPTEFEINFYDNRTEKIEQKIDIYNSNYSDEGFQYEIRHMCDCIRKELMESPVMSHAKSTLIMRQCDRLRKQWGLVYPFELC